MFNIEEFDIKLDTEVVGRKFILCEEIDSTNTYLLNNDKLDKTGIVCLAENQTKGKGRKGRNWTSTAEQNLTFSILLREKFKQSEINIINLGSSLAVAQAIENLYQLKVELKWPNDVLIAKKKTAGILLESTSRGNKIDKIVVGIGINVNQPNFPGRYNIQPTSIQKEFKKTVSRERLLSEVLNNFEEILEAAVTKPEKVLNDWKARCPMIGEKIKIEEDENVKHGIFHDIDENGYLLLKNQNKEIEKVYYGDVTLRIS